MNSKVIKKAPIIVWGLILFLASCGNRQKRHQNYYQKKTIADDFSLKEQEAKLADIPVLLDSIPTYGEPDTLVYESLLEPEEIRTFYRTQMEYLGWKYLRSYTEQTILVFEKPRKLSLITIQSLGLSGTINRTRIAIVLISLSL